MKESHLSELKLLIGGVGLMITGAELLPQPGIIDVLGQICLFIGFVFFAGAFMWKRERFTE